MSSYFALSASRRALVTLLISGAIAVLMVLALAPLAGGGPARFALHAPDTAYWFSRPIAIQIHVYAALTAFAIGLGLLSRAKGGPAHRFFGWAWIAAMGTAALSSLFILEINPGAFSLVHLITGWVIIALPAAVYAVRRKNFRMHRSLMTGLFIGGLVVAGALTFLPGRVMHHVFFG